MHLDLTGALDTLRAYWRADLKAEGDRVIAAITAETETDPDPETDPDLEPDPDLGPEPTPGLTVTAEPSEDGTTALVAWESEDTPSAWRTARDGVDSHGAGPWSYDWADPSKRELLFTRLIPGHTYTFTITNVATSRAASVTVTMPVPPSDPQPEPPPAPEGDVLWRANIDGAPVGRTSAAAISGIFGPTFATSSGVINNTEIVNVAGQKVMRQHIPANQLGELIASPKLPSRVDDATISFDVRFAPDFDWRHGLKVGAGLVGVRPGAGIYSPTSGKSRDTGCSIRIMVHGSDGSTRPFQGALGPLKPGTDNEVVTYLYVRHPNTGFNGFGWHRGAGSFTRGQWHHVKMRGRLNTPGRRDGVYQLWIDGNLQVELLDVDYRGSDSSILWDAVLWDTHRGGGKTANWLSPRNGYLDVRNVVVTEVSPPKAEPEPSVGLPVLGFSLNGEALSGPIEPGHYATLAGLAPQVWGRVGFSSDGDWRGHVRTYVNALRNAGMKILLRASFPGDVWAKKRPLDTAEQQAYGAFVGELAAFVRNDLGLGPDDVVFEHPNEMNGRVSGAEYAGAARAAWPRLKAVDPGFKIIGASENVYASGWQQWLRDVYAAGYADVSDGISFHNYDAQGDFSKYTFLEGLMRQHGHWPAMVWLTEFGASTPPGATRDGSPGAGIGGQSEAGQARRITDILTWLGDEVPWVTHAFIYADEDIPSRKASDPFEAHFGIFRNDASGRVTGPKPAVESVAQLYR